MGESTHKITKQTKLTNLNGLKVLMSMAKNERFMANKMIDKAMENQ